MALHHEDARILAAPALAGDCRRPSFVCLRYFFFHEDYVILKVLSALVYKDAAKEVLARMKN